MGRAITADPRQPLRQLRSWPLFERHVVPGLGQPLRTWLAHRAITADPRTPLRQLHGWLPFGRHDVRRLGRLLRKWQDHQGAITADLRKPLHSLAWEAPESTNLLR